MSIMSEGYYQRRKEELKLRGVKLNEERNERAGKAAIKYNSKIIEPLTRDEWKYVIYTLQILGVRKFIDKANHFIKNEKYDENSFYHVVNKTVKKKEGGFN